MFIEINGHVKKMGRFKINNLIIYLKDTEKQGQKQNKKQKVERKKRLG